MLGAGKFPPVDYRVTTAIRQATMRTRQNRSNRSRRRHRLDPAAYISGTAAIQITYPGTGNNSQFSYDGLSRCVMIKETTGGSVNEQRDFIWCASERCEARDGQNSDANLRQYFLLGQRNYSGSWTPYFWTTDHLGSVREMTDSSGTVGGTTSSYIQYSNDPYGQQSVIQSHGGVTAHFGYDGYYLHSRSGLNLTISRDYGSALGRWISRDPIGEEAGVNLYQYCFNDPADLSDPLGLFIVGGVTTATVTVGGTVTGAGAVIILGSLILSGLPNEWGKNTAAAWMSNSEWRSQKWYEHMKQHHSGSPPGDTTNFKDCEEFCIYAYYKHDKCKFDKCMADCRKWFIPDPRWKPTPRKPWWWPF